MDAPTPRPTLQPPRLGPRPLPLHLATEGWLLQMSFAGLMPVWNTSNNDSPLSSPIRRLAAEHGLPNPSEWRPNSEENAFDAVKFVDALTAEAKSRMNRLLTGVTRYQTHPFKRRRTAPEAIWSRGNACLRDYNGHGGGQGPAVVVVPSLVNRAYILDLAEDRSLMAFLAASGLRAFLLDWGEPGETERAYSADDYITRLIIPALEHARALTGQPPRLAGYCMGGTLSAAAAILRPDLISGLALLAAPWDFHADTAASRSFLTLFRPMIEVMIAAQACAPVDFLQAMFASLDPTLMGRKFRGFAARDMASDAAQRFVELEDWLNDGIPLVANVARQTLFDWYGDNTPLKNTWIIGGAVMDPSKISAPTLAVIPNQDRIVPPDSAKALARRITNCKTMTIELGHIGMMAGGSAPELLYEPLAKWLKNP
jgi:polyhydroxyalkanoate synthase